MDRSLRQKLNRNSKRSRNYDSTGPNISIEHFTQTLESILLQNCSYSWSQCKSQYIQGDWINLMHLIRSPWFKAGLKQHLKQKNGYIFMEYGNGTTFYWIITGSGKKLKILQNSLKMSTIHTQTWGTIKIVLCGKFIATSALLKKLESSNTNKLKV